MQGSQVAIEEHTIMPQGKNWILVLSILSAAYLQAQMEAGWDADRRPGYAAKVTTLLRP